MNPEARSTLYQSLGLTAATSFRHTLHRDLQTLVYNTLLSRAFCLVQIDLSLSLQIGLVHIFLGVISELFMLKKIMPSSSGKPRDLSGP